MCEGGALRKQLLGTNDSNKNRSYRGCGSVEVSISHSINVSYRLENLRKLARMVRGKLRLKRFPTSIHAICERCIVEIVVNLAVSVR